MDDPSTNGASVHTMQVGRYGVLYCKPRPPQNTTANVSPSPKVIDLRSDTVTKPTEEMRLAMFEAEVGDDVFGEDPTVILLEAAAARKLGKEAAVFVPSGTMSNLIATMSHCWGRGEEVLLGDRSHIYLMEQGGAAQFGNVHTRAVRTLPDGTLDLADLESKINGDDPHMTITRMVIVENSHNFTGGRVIRPEYMDKLAELIKGKGIKLHVDGARLFNTATALGVPAASLVLHCDSVSICLSKGLGAPVGSVLVGGADFIARARRLRKALGGNMRQVGVLAAPGLIALEKMSQRLHEDHENAKLLCKGLQSLSHLGIQIDPATVETNILMFFVVRPDLDAPSLVKRLEEGGGEAEKEEERIWKMEQEEGRKRQREGEEEEEGRKKQREEEVVVVKMMAFDEVKVRAVLNYHISQEDIRLVVEKIRKVLER